MAGLYIHFPFCVRKCIYCDFYSVNNLSLIDDWLFYLDLEISKYIPFWQDEFETLYLGGGSPSLLNEKNLKKLNKIVSKFKFAQDIEKTIELNPEDVSKDKIKIWQDSGFNRFSLGVQTFNENFLKNNLKRSHSVFDCIKALEYINSFAVDFSLDLIYGHFGQSKKDWLNDLETAVKFNPKHISTYCLTVEEKTIIFEEIKKGQKKLLSEKLSAELFYLSSKILNKYNYKRYEVSNFSLMGYEAKHNSKYWSYEKYLALGPSAHSFNTLYRWANFSSLEKWMNFLKNNKNPYEFYEKITDEIKTFETIMLGLRTVKGFDKNLLKKASYKILHEYIIRGFLFLDNGFVKPSEMGLLFADTLTVNLV